MDVIVKLKQGCHFLDHPVYIQIINLEITTIVIVSHYFVTM